MGYTLEYLDRLHVLVPFVILAAYDAARFQNGPDVTAIFLEYLLKSAIAIE